MNNQSHGVNTDAVVKQDPMHNGLALQSKSIAEPGKDEIKIKVLAAGICGTDLKIHNWTDFFEARMSLPVTMGHEACGIVEEVGQDVTHLKKGDMVALESHISCGKCYNCQVNKSHICLNLLYLGIDIDGVFAKHAIVPAKIACLLPNDTDPQVASLFEPLGLGVRAALSGSGVAGKDVLITGAGPIGLMAVIAASHWGANQIIISEVSPSRIEFIQRFTAQLGIHRVINPVEENLVKVVKEMTQGKGADVWIDFTGAQSAFDEGIQAVVAGGEARLFSSGSNVQFPINKFITKEVNILPIHGRLLNQTWFQSVSLIKSAEDKLKLLITHALPLEEFDKAFKLLISGEAIKVIFTNE